MSRIGSFGVLAVVSLCLLVPFPAAAWKPNSHVYFAERAAEDVLDAGSITLRKMQHFQLPTGQEPPLGSYLADPAIVDALRRFPNAFRAGALGPDAYPDLMTGQSVIHPEDADARGGSDAWLVYLYESARATNDPEVLAFAVGFLAHAAGDAYGHTLVNSYAGGPFKFVPLSNVLTHMDVEGYIGKKTPAPADGGWNADIGPSVKAFIYRTMVDASQGTHARTLYDRKSGTGLVSLPYIFSVLRDSLSAFVQEYRRDHAFLSERASKAPFPQNTFWAAALAGHILTVGPLALYAEAWISNIDRGLRMLPDVSMRVASSLIFTPNPNYLGAKDILDDYWRHHVKSMLGVPDIVVSISNFAEDVVAIVLPWNPVAVLEEAILEFMIQQATTLTPAEWLQHLGAPELTLANPTHVELDRMMGITSRTDSMHWEVFPAGSNTVTMIKLLMLGDTGLRQVLTTLGHPTPVADELLDRAHHNAMLGFMKSLDGSKQWAMNDDVMMFHGDCAAYQDLFVRQKGDDNEQVDPRNYQTRFEDGGVKERCRPVASVSVSPRPNSSTVPFYCEPTAVGEVVLTGPVGRFGGRVLLSGDAVLRTPQQVWVPANQTRVGFTTSIEPVRQLTVGRVEARRQNLTAAATFSVGPSRVTELRLREDFWESGWQRRYVKAGEGVRSASRFTAEIGMDCDHALRSEEVVVELCPRGAGSSSCVVLGRAAAQPTLAVDVRLPAMSSDGWFTVRARYLQSFVAVEVYVVGSRLARVTLTPNHVALSPAGTTPLVGEVELVDAAPPAGEVVDLTYARGLGGSATVFVPAGRKTARFSVAAPLSPILTCAGDIGVVSGLSRVERSSVPAVGLPPRSASPANPRAQFGYVMMDYAGGRSPAECYDVGLLDEADLRVALMMEAFKLPFTRVDPRPVDPQRVEYLPY